MRFNVFVCHCFIAIVQAQEEADLRGDGNIQEG